MPSENWADNAPKEGSWQAIDDRRGGNIGWGGGGEGERLSRQLSVLPEHATDVIVVSR
jgi:hypothetical protein